MTRRRCWTWPPSAQLLDDDDLLAEILLRLPLQLSSLPRAGLVCKRWRRLVTDPQFIRRYRAHHRTPPVLGFFRPSCRFFRTQEPQNRLPASRFSLDRWCADPNSVSWQLVHCLHGLVLYACWDESRSRGFVVADPMTGHRSRIANTCEYFVPPVAAAVVSIAAGIDRRLFRLVALFSYDYQPTVTASVYSSDSGVWADSVATLVLPFTPYFIYRPSTLIGNAIYWLLDEGVIIRFDLERHSLAIIEQPPCVTNVEFLARHIVTAEDGHLGFALLSECSIQLWETEIRLTVLQNGCCRKLFNWTRSFSEEHVKVLGITGFSEESSVILICTHDGVFTIHIKSIQFRKVYRKTVRHYIHPYSSF